MGAHKVIAIDHFPRRLELAKQMGAETLNYKEADVLEALWEMTGGIGPDACIDCGAPDAPGPATDNTADRIKKSPFRVAGRPGGPPRAIVACRKGGRLS